MHADARSPYLTLHDEWPLSSPNETPVIKKALGMDTVNDLPAAILIFPPSTTLSAKSAVRKYDLCLPILHKDDVSTSVSTAIIRARKGWPPIIRAGANLARGDISSSGEQAGRQEQDDAGGGMTIS
ncbi:hypothetical protein ARMGADRAFT_1091727 [Armillaria gallica]|uniref:Uncharacterized protein n=1 Tax=Armillaria gallica TaxID=47427 RepID=A0A2H3CD23_ARMGA|nr:hypothetical protein ARMGADRAFT_1091727 [Armillaria gallica]